jgi:DNA-binding response OmpR family regulator
MRAHEYVDEALRWLPEALDEGDGLHELPAQGPGLTAPESEGSAATVLPGVGKRIVLADDNADMRDYVRRLLLASGYGVTAVADGEAALAAVRQRSPDLLLTDVMMPKLDGFGLLRAIRNEPGLTSVPVIILSARAGEEAKVEGLEAGADDYLIKPFAARELLARVNANIQMADIRREASRAIFQSEQKVLMSEDRLRIALSTGRVAVFEWHVESDTVALLGPLSEIFGVDQESAAKAGLPLQAFTDAIHPDDRARVIAAIERSVATGDLYEAEFRVGTGDGAHYVVARGQVTSIPGGGQRMAGALLDLSERHAAQEALERHQDALELQARELEMLNLAAEREIERRRRVEAELQA